MKHFVCTSLIRMEFGFTGIVLTYLGNSHGFCHGNPYFPPSKAHDKTWAWYRLTNLLMKNKATTLLLILSMPMLLCAQYFEAKDVFGLEYASDPQISPDGSKIVYVRRSMDIMKDRSVSNLWIINSDGSHHRALSGSPEGGNSPVWSPDGSMLAYTARANDKTQIFVRWMESGESMQLSSLTESPSNLSWSPDGKWIAFSMFVPQKKKPVVQLPTKPEGAEWAPPAVYVDEVTYRSDGRGMLPSGYSHIFILPIEGGTPQATDIRRLSSQGKNFLDE